MKLKLDRIQVFRKNVVSLLGLLVLLTNGEALAAPNLATAKLRCEYKENPLGLDAAHPRLSWILTSSERGQRQTAYQVLVASSESLLKQNTGDLWDSGKVLSDQSALLSYPGVPLKSGQQCFWKVRAWDVNGQPSAWSEAALWTMGLLKPEEWAAARWIGEENRTADPNAEGYQWIWYPEGKPNEVAAAGTRYFRRQFTMAAGKQMTNATFNLTCDNGFILFINGIQAGQSENWSQPAKLNLKEFLIPGVNTLAIAATNTDSAAGLTGKLTVQLDDHTTVEIFIDSSWKTSSQERALWKTTNFDDRDWVAPIVLGSLGMAPWGAVSFGDGDAKKWDLPPPPYLRTVFAVSKPVQRAILYVTALGNYEMHLNGSRVGRDYFNPGYVEYSKRVNYQTYDVTALLRNGTNALGAILAGGWYCGYCYASPNVYGTVPKLCAQLKIEYADGTRQAVVTDDSWKLAYGPIREGDMQQGELYDARLEMPGWDTAAFGDANWKPVHVWPAPDIQIGVSPANPIQVQQEIVPVGVTNLSPGVFVFDLGQGISGWARIKASGQRGAKITLRYSMVLNPDGSLYTENLLGIRPIDVYCLKGDGREVWEPSTSWRGFRYVEVTGYPGTPTLDDLRGVAANTTALQTGTFKCSDERVNLLYSNILRTMWGNLLSVPTGDADRAERIGWCAKTPMIKTWTYALDIAGFLSKWEVDQVDSQSRSHNGAVFQQCAPFWGDVDSPGWSDDGISVPYGLYKAYGDTGIIEKHYDAMAKYIGYLQSKLVGNLRPANLHTPYPGDTNFVGYGDWVAVAENRERDADIFNTLLNGASVKKMAEMAAAIGRTSDAAAYRSLFTNMCVAFDRAYVSSRGVVRDDSQMEYALALYYGFIPPDKIPLAVSNLVNDIQNKSHQQTRADALGKNPIIPPGHLSTGFHSSGALLPVLSTYGRNDVAYSLLLQDTYPSWLYPVTIGATTTWERWDSWTPEKGFQDYRMNSFSMPDLMASITEWLFCHVGGIDQKGVGFQNLVIKPAVGAGLTWAQASYDSIHGTIEVRWEKSGGALAVNVTIPANTSATVSLPGSGTGPFSVHEGGKSVWSNGAYVSGVTGISGAAMNGDRVEMQVGSGTYHFQVVGGGL